MGPPYIPVFLPSFRVHTYSTNSFYDSIRCIIRSLKCSTRLVTTTTMVCFLSSQFSSSPLWLFLLTGETVESANVPSCLILQHRWILWSGLAPSRLALFRHLRQRNWYWWQVSGPPQHAPSPADLSFPPHSNYATMRFEPEALHGANAGLNVARDLLEPVKKEFPWISYGDLWTLAGVAAIQEMAGPKIPWRPGRIDGFAAQATPDGRLPDATQGADHLRNVSLVLHHLFVRCDGCLGLLSHVLSFGFGWIDFLPDGVRCYSHLSPLSGSLTRGDCGVDSTIKRSSRFLVPMRLVGATLIARDSMAPGLSRPPLSRTISTSSCSMRSGYGRSGTVPSSWRIRRLTP